LPSNCCHLFVTGGQEGSWPPTGCAKIPHASFL